jgi:RecB family exonuclease
VASPDDDGEQPSRFLRELGAGEPEHHQGRPRRPLSLAGVVADLRRTAADPAQPDELRRSAAHRLAALAATEVNGRPLAAAADPATWWGLRAPSRSTTPVRPSGEPVRLSASALQGLISCPAQWFLQQEAGGTVVSSTAQGFGIIVHALADRVAKGELGPDDDLMALVDDVWDRMSFRTPWSGEREREAVRSALARFVAWQSRPGARTHVSSEGRITATVELPDGQQVQLIGYVDRLELDAAGDVVVVDLKTGKYAPTDASLPENPQLGLYQLAVDHGAADDAVGRPVRSGGAELVQLRLGSDLPKVQPQAPQVPDADGVTVIERQLMAAVAAVRSEEFVARPGAHCDRCDFHALCPTKSSGSVLS